MKSFSTAFYVIGAIFITFYTHAESISSRAVIGCFRGNNLQVQVRDLVSTSSPTPAEVYTAVYDFSICNQVDIQVFTHQKKYLRSAQNPIEFVGCDLTSEKFCCVMIEPLPNPTAPEYADVPYVNFGDGLMKYEIIGVRCKP